MTEIASGSLTGTILLEVSWGFSPNEVNCLPAADWALVCAALRRLIKAESLNRFWMASLPSSERFLEPIPAKLSDKIGLFPSPDLPQVVPSQKCQLLVFISNT